MISRVYAGIRDCRRNISRCANLVTVEPEKREKIARDRSSRPAIGTKSNTHCDSVVVVTVNPGETQHRVKVDDGFNENKSHSRWGVDENTRRNGLGTERTFYATVVTGDVFARPDGWMDGCFAYAGNDALGKQRLGFLFGHVLLLDFLHPTRGRSCIRLVEERVSSAVSRTDPISGEKKWNRRTTLFFLLPRSPFFPLKIVSFSS